jgi:outer membrane lipoprotein SlyB
MRLFLPIVLAAALTGCTSMGAGYVPLVDMQGHDPARLEVDLQECQAFARGRIDAERSAVAGALIGGVIGAILAPRGYRNAIAGRTAAMGAAGGASEGLASQRDIIKRCLAGRGYSVLN